MECCKDAGLCLDQLSEHSKLHQGLLQLSKHLSIARSEKGTLKLLKPILPPV